MVHPYSKANTATAQKISRFILSDRSGFFLIDNLSTAVHIFPMSFLFYFQTSKVKKYGIIKIIVHI